MIPASSSPAPVATHHDERITILEQGRADQNYFRDLWHFRELFLAFAWRDMAIRYKQSVLGVGWALLRPALTMAVFTFVFSRVAGLKATGSAPYALFVLAGTLPWFLFSTILSDASQSLVGSANMIQKVYFPRIMTPLAAACVALVDMAVSFVLALFVMAFFGFMPDWRLIALPAFALLGLLVSIGPALLMSTLTVKYRDFRFLIPFVVQFGTYVTPVGYASSIVPEKWRLLYNLNPVVAVIDGFRWSMLRGETPLYLPGLLWSIVFAVAFLAIAITVFRRTEKTFADVI